MKGYSRYFRKKIIWFLITFLIALILNFLLPRLMPNDPIAGIMSRIAAGATSQTSLQEVYQDYARLFGIDQPIHIQFAKYIQNLLEAILGFHLPIIPDRWQIFFNLPFGGPSHFNFLQLSWVG